MPPAIEDSRRTFASAGGRRVHGVIAAFVYEVLDVEVQLEIEIDDPGSCEQLHRAERQRADDAERNPFRFGRKRQLVKHGVGIAET
ncbi:MAG TPA: hypothetical protein VF329_10615 [Gammaproteobacteria bacterium]